VLGLLDEKSRSNDTSGSLPLASSASALLLPPKDRLFEVFVPRPPLANAMVISEGIAGLHEAFDGETLLLSDVMAWEVPEQRMADLRAAVDLCGVLCLSRVLAFTTHDGICLL
jgi:hypothetical protein